MHQWLVYHLVHFFSFCCLWYPFILKTDGLEFSSNDGLCTGSTFNISWRLVAGPSWPNGKLVEKFYASKEITASSCCLHVFMFLKNSMNNETTVQKVWEKPWKTCQDSEYSSRDLNWRLCKYMAEVWLARLWHLFEKWLTSITYPIVIVKSENVLLLCSLNKLDIWTIMTQHVCSVDHTKVHVLLFFVCFHMITIGVFQCMFWVWYNFNVFCCEWNRTWW